MTNVNKVAVPNGVPVYLNIYDIGEYNDWLHPVGLGVFHTGVQISGLEYGYGGGRYNRTGVFTVRPRSASGCVYRERVLLGYANKSHTEIDRIVSKLSKRFMMNEYDVLNQNCNHFSEAFSQALLRKSIPSHLNRIAWCDQYMRQMDPTRPLEEQKYPSVRKPTKKSVHKQKRYGRHVLKKGDRGYPLGKGKREEESRPLLEK